MYLNPDAGALYCCPVKQLTRPYQYSNAAMCNSLLVAVSVKLGNGYSNTSCTLPRDDLTCDLIQYYNAAMQQRLSSLIVLSFVKPCVRMNSNSTVQYRTIGNIAIFLYIFFRFQRLDLEIISFVFVSVSSIWTFKIFHFFFDLENFLPYFF